ncbi:endo alpha-1,4 polygalactosaminidase [Nocardia sp. NPDC006044]|uniref:endo alpha-1,4 polygalactosaminidase n=1 Tax=Nocardia sp. NPDC006044 TaxID=3364306 RepID=UPI0036A13C06
MVFARTPRRRWLRMTVFAAVAAFVAACSFGSATADPGPWWHPEKGLTWQWQLHGEPVDTSINAQVYDIDLFENPAATVKTLHDQGRKVICYLSGGSWEPYRPDAGEFPDSVKSGPVPEWDDERWLDVKQIDVLKPLMAKRMDLCKQKGFDGVEPDWADLHRQNTGELKISAADQLAYNRMLAGLAHDRGLAIGLKNDLDQVSTLAGLFDFSVNEQCFEERASCDKLTPFLAAGKPVFHAEYTLRLTEFCADSARLGLSSIRKHRELDAWRETC